MLYYYQHVSHKQQTLYLFKYLHLCQNQFGLSRSLCSLGEHLKSLEHKLIFLKRCNQTNVIPPFINNSVKIKNVQTLFPINCSYYLSNYTPRIKKASLKQNIKKTYLEIAAIKSKLVGVKNQLKQSVSTELHHEIMSIFDDNNRCIKFSEKRRLIEKFQWLTRSRITKRTDNTTW